MQTHIIKNYIDVIYSHHIMKSCSSSVAHYAAVWSMMTYSMINSTIEHSFVSMFIE
jgi:hypothetical protein